MADFAGTWRFIPDVPDGAFSFSAFHVGGDRGDVRDAAVSSGCEGAGIRKDTWESVWRYCILLLYLLLPPSFLSYAGIIGGIGVGLSADYGWQSFFNSFGAMAVATGLIGLPGAIFFRILHNICGSLYGQIFYRLFEKSVRRFVPST